MASHSRVAGFTLLEVLIALAILSVALGALYQTFSTSLTHQATAVREAEQSATAQSILARVGGDLPIEPGERSGRVDGVTWRLTMTQRPAAAATSVHAFEVTLVLAAEGEQPVTLRTTRLVPMAVGQ